MSEIVLVVCWADRGLLGMVVFGDLLQLTVSTLFGSSNASAYLTSNELCGDSSLQAEGKKIVFISENWKKS